MKHCVSTLAAVTIALLPMSGWSEDSISYSRDIKKILSNNCFECHGPDSKARKKTPRLDSFEGATAETSGGTFPLVPGDPGASEIVALLTSDDPDSVMPPADSGKHVTPGDIELIRQWIAEGGEYEAHWSYVAPKKSPFPEVSEPAWPSNGIDRYVLARLDAEKLSPFKEADRRTLMRRVSLDLIGLPPTPEAVNAFVNDKQPKAYARMVETLLESPAYGERWAQLWLDLARYADSMGYEKDANRTIWKYRDWVINALNADMPYTQFTIEQIAGDLLENPTEDQIIATAFHRNTMNNDEGGTDNEEFRTAAVVDRVITTMQVWMGTTMMCAQCHDHKYDPITTEEFYRFYDFFNQTADNDLPSDAPVYWNATDEQKAQSEELKKDIQAFRGEFKKHEEALKTASEEEKPELTKIRDEAKARQNSAQEQLNEINNTTVRTPVMVALAADQQRTSHIMNRGSFLDLGKEVSAGTPEAFQPFPKDTPLNRLGLAQWLVSTENPLTARVTVNRYWEQFFGAGLVATSEEFGTQGDLPTHPDLLDWLAVEFMENNWSLKQLCRTIVMSSTYRQVSSVTPELLERDSVNELYARGPRFRLGAEQVRDQALAVSGLLSPKMYGPPVKPYQPEGVWQVVYNGSQWEQSEGEDAHRRALYTYMRRSSPYPSMLAFDSTSREVCTVRRIRTNTPLQALVTLNDPVYVEAAQSMARRIMTEPSDILDVRIDYAMQLALGRYATKPELKHLSTLYTQAHEEYTNDADNALTMASSWIGSVPEGMAVDELAAWTVVCNALMNVDEFLTKR